MTVLLVAAVTACEQAPISPAIPSDLLITLERTPCLGTCPVYEVSIDAGGLVRWNGREHVDAVGEFTGSVSSEAVRSLLARFEELEFANLRDSYAVTVTDVGGAHITLSEHGHTKRIELYGIGYHDYGSLVVWPEPTHEDIAVDEHDLAAAVEARMSTSRVDVGLWREFDALGELCDAVDLTADSAGWIGTCPRSFRFPCEW